MAVEPISVAAATFFGDSGEGNSLMRGQAASISADGQLVVFQSDARDLVPNDRNNATDVFLFNRSTGGISLISVDSAGAASGSGASFNAEITPDGRFILYESEATNLIAGTITGGGGKPDIFLHDLQTQTTTLVTKSASGATGGNRASFNASISADGRFVAFESHADNLAADTSGGGKDIFLRDLQTQTTTLVSRTPTGASGNDVSYDARISADGRFIAFGSIADDLVSNDGTNIEDVFVYDVQTGTIELITIDSDEVNQSNSHNFLSNGRAISADGRYVIFETAANNLVPQFDDFQGLNTYLRDRQLGTTTVVTISADGSTATGGIAGSLSVDGRYVAFVSGETDLVAGISDSNAEADVFLRDLQTGTTRIVSVNAAGTAAGNRRSGTAQYPFDFSAGALVLSSDGRHVAFASEASNLVSGLTDNNDTQTGAFGTRRRDVFVRDMQAITTTLVSINNAGTGTGENGSYTPAMSADGSVIAFESDAADLLGARDKQRF